MFHVSMPNGTVEIIKLFINVRLFISDLLHIEITIKIEFYEKYYTYYYVF